MPYKNYAVGLCIECVGFIMSPFVDERGHVFGPFAIKEHAFSGARMGETERLGVQYLSRAECKTVLNILLVFLRAQTFENLASAVFVVAEQRVSDMLHMRPYLMGASGLQFAFEECHIGELLQHPPVGDGFFGLRTVLQIPYAIDSAVSVIARQSTGDCPALLFECTPYEGIIGALGGMLEELMSEVCLRLRCLGDEQQTGGIFVDTVDETDGRIVDINF